jgi:hypothetical protein
MCRWLVTLKIVVLCIFNSLTATEEVPLKEQVDSLNRQIDVLQKKLKLTRIEEMKNEIESERYFRAEGDIYINKVEKAERNEKEIEVLKEELKVLEKKKEEIRQKMDL